MSLCIVNTAIRFMSNPYLAVGKVTESLVGNTKVKLSLDLTVNDKRREGVACSVGPLLTYLPEFLSGTKTSVCLSQCRGLSFSVIWDVYH